VRGDTHAGCDGRAVETPREQSRQSARSDPTNHPQLCRWCRWRFGTLRCQSSVRRVARYAASARSLHVEDLALRLTGRAVQAMLAEFPPQFDVRVQFAPRWAFVLRCPCLGGSRWVGVDVADPSGAEAGACQRDRDDQERPCGDPERGAVPVGVAGDTAQRGSDNNLRPVDRADRGVHPSRRARGATSVNGPTGRSSARTAFNLSLSV